MPDELADLHSRLSDEMTWLCLHWKKYVKLFAQSQKRVDLLSKTAPNFFAHFEDLSWQTTLLGLCRLTDPPRSVGKDNLSITRLSPAVGDEELADRLEPQIEQALDASAFARDWRNRRFAHRSLELVRDPELKPLAPASRNDVDHAIDQICTVLNMVGVHYNGVYHDYRGVIAAFEGSEALIYFLSSGLEAEERRQAEGMSWRPAYY